MLHSEKYSNQGHLGNSFDPEFSNADFQFIAMIAHQRAGLDISPDKAALVAGRILRRIKLLGMKDYESYCNLLRSEENHPEHAELISLLTTNVTHFFREKHHFIKLREAILPKLIERARNGKRVRIWSAGCSSGQEPYSIGLEILSSCPEAAALDLKLLATDIDPAALSVAESGVYSADSLTSAQHPMVGRYFSNSNCHATPHTISAKNELKEIIHFRQLNLIQSWPFTGTFDVIFCRNVLIYFSQETQNSLWPRFEAALSSGGTLFLGHSERVNLTFAPSLRATGLTEYTRKLVNE